VKTATKKDATDAAPCSSCTCLSAPARPPTTKRTESVSTPQPQRTSQPQLRLRRARGAGGGRWAGRSHTPWPPHGRSTPRAPRGRRAVGTPANTAASTGVARESYPSVSRKHTRGSTIAGQECARGRRHWQRTGWGTRKGGGGSAVTLLERLLVSEPGVAVAVDDASQNVAAPCVATFPLHFRTRANATRDQAANTAVAKTIGG
jgi:hypothetical protein